MKIMRDMKSFTSKTLRKKISEHENETRKKWILKHMKQLGTKNKNNIDFQF